MQKNGLKIVGIIRILKNDRLMPLKFTKFEGTVTKFVKNDYLI